MSARLPILNLFSNSEWSYLPSSNTANSGEIVYAKGDETIDAGAANDACRILILWDETKNKAALIHFCHERNCAEIKELLTAAASKKFDRKKTKLFLAGDVDNAEKQEWNRMIKKEIIKRGYKNPTVITKGRGKDVYINPEQAFLVVFGDHQERVFLADKQKRFHEFEPEILARVKGSRGNFY